MQLKKKLWSTGICTIFKEKQKDNFIFFISESVTSFLQTLLLFPTCRICFIIIIIIIIVFI